MDYKINIKEVLEEELIKVFVAKSDVKDITLFFKSIFDFIEEKNTKALKNLANKGLILEEEIEAKTDETAKNLRITKSSVMQNLLTSFIIYQKDTKIKDVEKMYASQEERIVGAAEQIENYKKEAEQTKVYTVNNIIKNMDITRDRLAMIASTAGEIETIQASSEKEEKDLAVIQNNIIGQVETIVKQLEDLKLWPENVEKPNYKKNEKVQKKNFKRAKKSSTEKIDKQEFKTKDLSVANASVDDNVNKSLIADESDLNAKTKVEDIPQSESNESKKTEEIKSETKKIEEQIEDKKVEENTKTDIDSENVE